MTNKIVKVLVGFIIASSLIIESYGDDINSCKFDTTKVQLHLRGAFIFDKWLFLLTKDWFIYQLPITYLTVDYGRLLMNETAVKIEDKWPVLAAANFSQIKPKINYIFSFNNNRKPSLLFLPHYSTGLLLNLYTQNIIRNFKGNHIPNDMVIISNLENVFYSLSLGNKSQICMQPWIVYYHPNGDVSKFESTDTVKYIFTSKNMSQVLVADDNEQSIVPKGFVPFINEKMTGFIWENNFTLFSPSEIYFFPVEAMNKTMKPFPLMIVSAHEYFICTLKKSNVGIWIGVIMAIVVVLIVILICCLLIQKKFRRKRRKKKKSNLHSKSAAPMAYTERSGLSQTGDPLSKASNFHAVTGRSELSEFKDNPSKCADNDFKDGSKKNSSVTRSTTVSATRNNSSKPLKR
ncbi:hypothetical protein RDWZM_000746 [Blomia tropicalis]|uniref:Uncharacterized protein n=1 Tax=Blomia tropicalis TaxID=40697 RepID=A0A9Q0RPY9_BLOTA|nr:hypothetical protein RDWZM_000746 [Blomia tropicalis]